MCHLPKLQTLNISGNVQLNLVEIRPVFQNLTELRALSIADITNMPLGLFVPLSNLQVLNISGTHLNNETLQILNPLAKLKVSELTSQKKCVTLQIFLFIFILFVHKSEFQIRQTFIIRKFMYVCFFAPVSTQCFSDMLHIFFMIF